MRLFRLFFFLQLVNSISLVAAEKPRVFITDSESWQISGGFTASEGKASGSVKGGARPQTVEIMKSFGDNCVGVTVTINRENADFVVLFDHEGAKGFGKDNKIAVFKKNGDMIYSGSTRTLGNAVKDACRAIAK